MGTEQARRVAEHLQQLRASQPASQEELLAWYQRARQFTDLLKSDSDLCNRIPGAVWRYLSDADIRMKDAEVRVAQESTMDRFQSGLRRGVFLDGPGIDRQQVPVRARVDWTCEKRAARLPQGTSYSTVARFAEDGGQWPPQEAWSIVLTFAPGAAHGATFAATASFLVADAPWERLKPGCSFDLYEGLKKTATVTVLLTRPPQP